jgi:hypothetical protein
MNQKIYRQEALQRLSSIDQLDQLMPLTSPRGWIALAAAGLLLLVAGLWAVLGTVTVTVEGEGVLTRPGGVRAVTAPDAGQVKAVDVAIGQEVRAGETLVRLVSASATDERKVVSPVEGRVVALAVDEGASVEKGAALATIEPLNVPLRAVLFVPASEGYQVKPGQLVRLAPQGGKADRDPNLKGRVASAARYPASRETIVGLLGSDSAAHEVCRQGPCLEVVVELKDDQGLYSGAPCRAHIVVARKRPISLVLPIFGSLGLARHG